MDLECVIQSQASQKEKNKFHLISLVCGIWKNGTDELICKAEIESQIQRTNLWTPKGQEQGEELGDWDRHVYTTMYQTDD